jgi:hypothetical protein
MIVSYQPQPREHCHSSRARQAPRLWSSTKPTLQLLWGYVTIRYSVHKISRKIVTQILLSLTNSVVTPLSLSLHRNHLSRCCYSRHDLQRCLCQRNLLLNFVHPLSNYTLWSLKCHSGIKHSVALIWLEYHVTEQARVTQVWGTALLTLLRLVLHKYEAMH